MTRFRPTVEPLDARTLPSAVFAAPDATPPEGAAVVDTAARPAAGGDTEQSLSLNFPKITFKDAVVSGKVTFQDFHFTAKVNKASPQ